MTGDGVARVVLADDQAIVRAGLTVLLQGGAGERIAVVGEASDGAQVVGLTRRTRPDVVLMDVRMPGVGGVAATRALRADPGCAGVAVLMLTTFDTDAEVHTFGRAVAEALIEIAVVVLFGAALTHLLQRAARLRAEEAPSSSIFCAGWPPCTVRWLSRNGS
ncbi:response regulator transcription factor [Actinoplanes sp. NPDC048796]|uniref:response regulator n=1 Tax=Actinoplanes sp. NPDC048796 TaxID=3155640 RepID=UPI0034054834